MKHIGAQLRQIREEKALTLKDVQAETKIRQKYLEALENGDEHLIPGEVYLKGFLRSYANLLGLDGMALVNEFKAWKESQAPKSIEEPLRPKGQPVMPRFPHLAGFELIRSRGQEQDGRGVWPRFLTVLTVLVLFSAAIILAVGAGVYFAKRNSDAPLMTPPPSQEEGGGDTNQPSNEPNSSNPTPDRPKVQVVETERLGDRVRFQVIGADRLEVTVDTAEGECWVQVVTDGQVVYEGVLRTKDVQTWSAPNEVRIRAGNPGILSFTVNGQYIGVVEPRKAVWIEFLRKNE